MEVVASLVSVFTLTFSQDFTEHLKLFLGYHIQRLLIFGALVPLLLNFILVFRYFLVRMKLSNWPTSWKFIISRTMKLSKWRKELICFLTRKINQNCQPTHGEKLDNQDQKNFRMF